MPLGEFPGGSTPKAMSEEEILELIDAYAAAARRAMAAGLDGVEFHLSHGYLPWQFLSPLYNKRTDRWGGSHEGRLRFPVEAMAAIRDAIGRDAFMGYRINSTSFWPGDLEIDQVKEIVRDLERKVDLDYVSVSAGVHHSFIHTPMHFEGGWEKGYAGEVRKVSSKPVLLVGRITTPDVAEQLLKDGHGDAVCLARQLFADPEWANKAREGREEDIRRCVAANLCWRNASTGQRVQCIYNPTIGREGKWGVTTLVKVAEPKKLLVIGGGPAGLECARVAAARGHRVSVYEREAETGGHVRIQSLLPDRGEFASAWTWLDRQARKNGAEILAKHPVAAENLDEVLAREDPDHVVVATGSRVCVDGFQGWTGGSPARLGDRPLRWLGCRPHRCGGRARRGAGRRRRLERDRAPDGGQAAPRRHREGAAGNPVAHGGHGDDCRRVPRLDPAEAFRDRGRDHRPPLRAEHPRQPGRDLQRAPRGAHAHASGGHDRNGDPGASPRIRSRDWFAPAGSRSRPSATPPPPRGTFEAVFEGHRAARAI